MQTGVPDRVRRIVSQGGRIAADLRRTLVGPLPHNLRVARGDAYAIGVVKAGGPFVAVLVIRLGATPVEIALVTAIPALAGLLLAVPIGLVIQRSSAIVRIYSTSRLIAGFGWVAMAVSAATLPASTAVVAILTIWALAAVPTAVGTVAFPVVMSAAAGPGGRYEIMGLRFAIAALTTGLAAVVIGLVLDTFQFATNYLLVFLGITVAAIVSYHYSRQFQLGGIDTTPTAARSPARFQWALSSVGRYPRFVGYTVRQLAFRGGMLLAAPLFPLYAVGSLGASDAWVGANVAAQSAAAVIGYLFWSSRSRRWAPTALVVVPLIVVAMQPLLVSLTTSLEVILVVSAVAGFFAAGVNLALFDALMETVPKHRAPTFTGIDLASVSAVGVVAPILGGLAAQALGVEKALWLATAICAIGTVLFAIDAHSQPKVGDVPAG